MGSKFAGLVCPDGPGQMVESMIVVRTKIEMSRDSNLGFERYTKFW